jgi:hypothetical protein
MCCSFSVIQGARVEISTNVSNFTPPVITNIVSAIKSRRTRWTVVYRGAGEMRITCKILVGKFEWKRPFGKPWCCWEDNKVDLVSIQLAQAGTHSRTIVKAIMNIGVL